MINQLLSLDPGPDTLLAFRYWIHGFAIQTIIYGINVVLFLMTTWVLGLHIFKGLRTNRFHRHHLFQNSILLSFTITIFTFSTVYMGHQGIVTADAWTRFLQGENIADVPIVVFKDRAALVTACSAVSVLVNWGTVSILVSTSHSFPEFHSNDEASYGGVRFIGRSSLCFPLRLWHSLMQLLPFVLVSPHNCPISAST